MVVVAAGPARVTSAPAFSSKWSPCPRGGGNAFQIRHRLLNIPKHGQALPCVLIECRNRLLATSALGRGTIV